MICVIRSRPGAGDGGEPADNREAIGPHAGADHGALRTLGRGLGQGVRSEDRRQHRGGHSGWTGCAGRSRDIGQWRYGALMLKRLANSRKFQLQISAATAFCQ